MESKTAVLLDTNVSLDETLDTPEREPFKKNADRIFSLVKKGYITAYISASTITDNFYLLHNTLHSKDKAMERLEHLLSMVQIATVDDADIRRAVSLHWPDFEDAVQFTAAESAQADYIITRNIKDYKLAPPEKIITPADFVALFTNANEGKDTGETPQ
jgi:predicted nucleic acid-binding protein